MPHTNTNTKPLAGKLALVTGGSRGIGAAIARALASDGADVAISYAASGQRARGTWSMICATKASGLRPSRPTKPSRSK